MIHSKRRRRWGDGRDQEILSRFLSSWRGAPALAVAPGEQEPLDDVGPHGGIRCLPQHHLRAGECLVSSFFGVV